MNNIPAPCPVFIYGLICPIRNVIRYVGKSKDPHDRLHGSTGHLAEARRGIHGHTRRIRWIKTLLAKDQAPSMVVLETVDDSTWEAAEKRWIAHYRKVSGRLLTNLTAGGDGLHSPSAEVRRRMSVSHIGLSHSTEARRKIAINHRGANTPETNKKIGDAHRGRKHTDRSRENMSAAHIGKIQSAETIEKRRKANTGRVRSAAVLFKMRNGKGKTAEERVRTATEIIHRLHRGESYRSISHSTGIGHCTVFDIAHGTAYRDLPRPWHPLCLPPHLSNGPLRSVARGSGLNE